MIIENMQITEQNPGGMAYFTPSGLLKFNCVTPIDNKKGDCHVIMLRQYF
jgi:hypothetical protein